MHSKRECKTDTALRKGLIVKGIQNIETDRAFTLEELEQFMNDHYSRKGQFWHENRDIPSKNPDLERYCEPAALPSL